MVFDPKLIKSFKGFHTSLQQKYELLPYYTAFVPIYDRSAFRAASLCCDILDNGTFRQLLSERKKTDGI